MEPQEDACPKLSYRFFSKPMASRFVGLESSARAWNSKCASLSQEVLRRLQNTASHLPLEESTSVLEEFSPKLTRYGYSRVQSMNILESGIGGFKNKMARAQVHRTISTI